MSSRQKSPLQKIVHITPALPPAINGVGDFSALLVKNFCECGYTNNLFFVTRHELEHRQYDNVFQFNQKDFYAKLLATNPATIILHYAGYSYHQKGLPFYLVADLKRYKKKTGCRVLVFFHELYSSSNSLFKLSFYTNPFQKKVVRELYALSDKTFTNCLWYQNLLRRVLRRHPVKNSCTGIFSNVPDDLYDAGVEKNSTAAVVFGSAQRRKAVYDNPQLPALLDRAGIKLIYDIGPGKIEFSQSSIKFMPLGCLAPADVAHYLNEARFGLIDYPPALLAKSGIFSAYTAFGLVPVNTYSKAEALSDGLEEGINYFNLESALPLLVHGEVKQAVTDWYKGRNQQAITNSILQYV